MHYEKSDRLLLGKQKNALRKFSMRFAPSPKENLMMTSPISSRTTKMNFPTARRSANISETFCKAVKSRSTFLNLPR